MAAAINAIVAVEVAAINYSCLGGFSDDSCSGYGGCSKSTMVAVVVAAVLIVAVTYVIAVMVVAEVAGVMA